MDTFVENYLVEFDQIAIFFLTCVQLETTSYKRGFIHESRHTNLRNSTNARVSEAQSLYLHYRVGPICSLAFAYRKVGGFSGPVWQGR
jgi:hypothetical protein